MNQNNISLEKVIEGLEGLTSPAFTRDLPCSQQLFHDALALLKSLSAFKLYFDSLYGEGFEVVNYHMNGATEPFDNFYDSAMEESENA